MSEEAGNRKLRTTKLAVVIMAAGKGTRLKSKRPKVLHEVGGKPLLSHVIRAAERLAENHDIHVIVGHEAARVREAMAATGVQFVQQKQQRGTGHAVQVALAELGQLTGDVVVTMGDVPMLTGDTLAGLVAEHRAQASAVTVLTARVADPTGYGRIVRDSGAGVTGIVLHVRVLRVRSRGGLRRDQRRRLAAGGH